jgi:hypothetical protein
MQMTHGPQHLVEVLSCIIGLVAETQSSVWATLTPAEVIAILEREKKSLVDAGRLHDKAELASLFAPTGDLQELSIANGWSDEYIRLASAFDVAIKSVV